jgi:hypothetical protein
MQSKDLSGVTAGRVAVALLPLAMLSLALAAPVAHAGDHSRLPSDFSGQFNDYTPPAPTVSGGPYEMHGKWALHLVQERGTATFSAEMTMETADFANTDTMNHDPTKLGPHTHHISVSDGILHSDPTDPINWTTQCPVFKPPVSGGFVITGTAYVTGNGGNPPFGNPSTVTLCILGGAPSASVTGVQTVVEFSNFTLTFGPTSKAATHFGMQAINGVVARCERPWTRVSNDCELDLVD